MRAFLLFIFLFSGAGPLGAQSPAAYQAYKSLLDSFGAVTPHGPYYILTTDSGTGLADSLGRVLLSPGYKWTGASLTGAAGYHTWNEFSRPGEAAIADLSFNILQRGPYERYWSLDAGYKLFYVFAGVGKGGVRTRDGRWLVPPVYDAVHNFDGFRWPLVLLSKDGRHGAVDTATGREVIPFRFDYISSQPPYLVAHTRDSVHLYDSTGLFRSALPYHDIHYFDGHFTAERYGSWALLDSRTLRPLTPFVYEELFTLHSPRHLGFKKARDFAGVMDSRATVIVPDQYDHLIPTGDGSFTAYADLTYTGYDREARLSIPAGAARSIQNITTGYPQVDIPDWVLITEPAGSMEPYLAGLDERLATHLYNTRLKKAFPYTLKSERNVHRDPVFFGGALMEVVKLGGDAPAGPPALMRRSGEVLPVKYQQLEESGFGVLRVTGKDGLIGMLDSGGRWVLKPVWADAAAIAPGVFAAAKTKGGAAPYRLLRPEGVLASPDSFAKPPQPFGRDYIAQGTGGYGMLDSRLRPTIPLGYDAPPLPASDGKIYKADSSLFIVQQGGGAGVVSSDGRSVLAPVWKEVRPFDGVFILIDTSGRIAVARRDGHLTTPLMRVPNYPVLNHFGDALVCANDGTWGAMSYLGDTLLPFVYDTASFFYSSGGMHWWLRRGRMYTLINSAGDVVADGLPCQPTDAALQRGVIFCDTLRRFIKSTGGWKLISRASDLAAPSAPLFLHDELFGSRRSADGSARAGLYNRARRRVADYPPRTGSYDLRGMQTGPLLLYTDSAAHRFAVLDTGGRIVLPLTKADSFWLLPQAAIAADARRQRYIIYHLTSGRRPDTATGFASLHERSFREGGSRFAALPNWGSKTGLVVWHSARGTGMLDVGSELDTFLPGIQAFPWYGTSGQWGSRDLPNLLARPIGSLYWGLLAADTLGWRIPPVLDTIFYEGQTFRFREEGKMGLLSVEDLSLIMPAVWDTVFSDGGRNDRPSTYWVAKKGSRYSIVARGGRVISDGWDELTSWSGRMYLLGRRGGAEYLVYPAADGSIASEPYDPEPTWDGGGTPRVHQFRRGEKWGVYNAALRIIAVPAEYDHIDNKDPFYVAYRYDSAACAVRVYNEVGQLKFTLPCAARLEYRYESHHWDVDDYAKATALDTSGRILVPAGYERAERLNNELFAVYRDGKYGILTLDGKLVEPLTWDDISADFHAPVGSRDGKSCLFELDGSRIKTHCYEEVVPEGYNQQTGRFQWYVQQGSKWGRVDQQGKVLAPFRYASYEEAIEKTRTGRYRLTD